GRGRCGHDRPQPTRHPIYVQLHLYSCALFVHPLRPAAACYFFSIPLVAPLPGLVAQQKAESSPQAVQLCLSSVMSPLACPTTVKVELQPLHACVPISSVGWPCSFKTCAPFTPCFTRVTQTVLHLAHTIAMLSPVL